jgi:hypothetical protein
MRDAIRIAVAAAVLGALPAATASGQTTFRETGSVTVGSALVWVRGTNAGVVQLFVGHGFHDAFARAHEVSATTLARWIDSVRVVAPARDSATAESQLRASVLSADVTMMRRAGGPLSGLRLLMSGEDPIAIPEPAVGDFLAVLDSAARVSAALSRPAPAPAPSVAVVPAPTPPAAAPSAPDTTPAVAPASVASIAPAGASPAPLGSSTAQPPPELVLPAPSAPVMLLASRVEIVPPPTIVPAPTPVPPVPAAAVTQAPAVEVAPSPVPVVATAPPPLVAPTPAPDTVPTPPHVDVPADKLIRTPLGPFTIPGALLADRDKEAQYCYAQLGLKYNPDLKGEITVQLTLASDGSVQDAVVTKRSWQGISAGEVEACVRALAHDWSFPATDSAVASGAKLLTFSFTP